jgi:ABC-type multidrug transport system fused ATPase/permease subunit
VCDRIRAPSGDFTATVDWKDGTTKATIAKIRDRMSTLRIGSPLDKAIDIGAIVGLFLGQQMRADGKRGQIDHIVSQALRALDDVSLSIEAGETVCLVGDRDTV